MNPQDYMKIALKEAEKAFKADEVPVGALIVDPISGEIVARAHNVSEHGKDAVTTPKLEVMRKACRRFEAKTAVGVGNVCDAGTLHDVRGGPLR